MDIESERVIKLIFPDGTPENLQDNPELLAYLSKLGTYKIENLKRESQRLAEENKSLIEQTQDLAISNFKTFIRTSQCSRSIFKEFQVAENQIENISEKFPDLTKTCEKFLEDVNEINKERRSNSLTLKNHVQLLEFLELPQLMKQCIENGHMEEAIELGSYIHKLGKNYSHINLINSIAKEVGLMWHEMLLKFIDELKTDLQLPKCLQIVGYLRRMQAFGESELRLKFLQARDVWLVEVLDAIPKDDAQQHLSKTIEVTRINLFNIITQYRATFPDENAANASSSAIGVLEIVTCNGSRLFQSWLHKKIDDFLMTLETDLLRGMNSYDTILGQCMYFGLSFSRVGIDFRGLIAPIFIRALKRNFSKSIKVVSDTFNKEIESFTFLERTITSFHANKLNIEKMGTTQTTTIDQNMLSPPDVLLDYYPLASLCNGYLNALNELRLCAPIAIANDVTRCLQESLELAGKKIQMNYNWERNALSDNNRDALIKFSSCFAYDLLPYIQRCIHVIFPQEKLANHLGINLLTLESEGITYLQQKKILEPLQELLPNKVDVLLMQEKAKLSSIVDESSAAVGEEKSVTKH